MSEVLLYLDLYHNKLLSGILLICSDPGPLVPKVFQRSLFVARQPPFAELYLHEEQNKSDQQANCIAAIGREIKAEGEIDDSA